jgi:putative FmdB family regulatory protein
MPLYEFRCRICDQRFEVRRPMSDAAEVAACPHGHDDTVRLLSTFATAGSAATKGSTSGGGCCGGACGCAN